MRRPSRLSAPCAVPLALTLAIALGGCGDSGGGGGSSGPSTPVAEFGCTACHRIGKEGSATVGNDLTHVGSKLSAAQIRDKLLNPPSGMPTLSSVSDTDIARIVRYLSAQR